MNEPRPPTDFRAVFAPRRARLAASMTSGAAIVPTSPERLRNRDAHYPYRYDSYFYYLSGFPEPEAVLVLLAGATPRSILFCRDKDLEREIWDGFRFGPDAARELFGFDECYSISELDTRMPQLLADQPALYCHLGADAVWDARVLGWINAVRAQVRSGVAAPSAIHDLHRADAERPTFVVRDVESGIGAGEVRVDHEVGVGEIGDARDALNKCGLRRRGKRAEESVGGGVRAETDATFLSVVRTADDDAEIIVCERDVAQRERR